MPPMMSCILATPVVAAVATMAKTATAAAALVAPVVMEDMTVAMAAVAVTVDAND